MTTLSKIEHLEGQLTATLTARPVVVDTLTQRIAKAEAILETFQKSPTPGDIDKSLAAVGTVTAAKTLLASLGGQKPWQAYAESAFIVRHRAELTELLESLLTERASKRIEYREASALEIGRLSAEIVRLDGNGASDAALETVNAKLASIEGDLARREARLSAAAAAIRSFQRARDDASAYQPLYAHWRSARDSVAAVNFEISRSVVTSGTTPAHAV
jgi:hypothetical protein